MVQVRLLISGHVQGVGFRIALKELVFHFPGVRGWTRNLKDGRVEACLQGKESDVQALYEWIRKTPPAGKVKEVEYIKEPLEPMPDEFEIKPTA
jgi:acylphosphatase